jgi:hypothetical protein
MDIYTAGGYLTKMGISGTAEGYLSYLMDIDTAGGYLTHLGHF